MTEKDVTDIMGEPSNVFAFDRDGDPDKDSPEQAKFRSNDRKISEGMCPNGCGPMIQDGNRQDCPKCKFSHVVFGVRA